MPIDFTKLNDPEWLAKIRADEAEKQAAIAKRDEELRTMIRSCMEHVDELKDPERSLVNSCRHRMATFGIVSEKQEKWLRDIASRFEAEVKPSTMRPR